MVIVIIHFLLVQKYSKKGFLNADGSKSPTNHPLFMSSILKVCIFLLQKVPTLIRCSHRPESIDRKDRDFLTLLNKKIIQWCYIKLIFYSDISSMLRL